MENKVDKLRSALSKAREQLRGESDRKEGGFNDWSAADEIAELQAKLEKEKLKTEEIDFRYQRKIADYKALIEDEERVITALKQKLTEANETIEMLTEELQQARELGVTDSNIPKEYMELYDEMKDLLVTFPAIVF